MFMHVSWFHILGNMLFLLIFGNNVEDAFGRLGYLAFYLGGGIAATVVQTAVTLLFGTADDARSANLGASGAIAAVLGAYIVLYPKARIFGFFGWIPFRLPAWFVLGFWFVFQLFAGNVARIHPNKTGGGVAFFAHVGGFVFGVVVALILSRTGRITAVIDKPAQVRQRTGQDHPPPTTGTTPSALAAPGKSSNIVCFNCGHVQPDSLGQPTFKCAECGTRLRRKAKSAMGSS